jgi:hypothetical protein
MLKKSLCVLLATILMCTITSNLSFPAEAATVTAGETIALKALSNNNYVCADNTGVSPLIANRTSYGPWEQYQIVDAGGGLVAFKALANNNYVSVQSNNQLIAVATTIGANEKFQIIDAGGSDINIKANVNGKFVCADISTTLPLTADRTTAGAWEKFQKVLVSSSPTIIDRTGWTASASLNNGAAGYALDGNASTRWDTTALQANGQWFMIDMKANNTINKIRLDTTGSPNDYPRGYQVFVSTDGTNFGSSIASGAGSSAVTDIAFADKTARYIKIVQTGSAPGNYWSIHEFYAYGAGSLPPSVTISPSSTNIKYFGRWDKSSSSVYKSYWAGAYFKVNFTGTTVKLNLAGASSIIIKIDNAADVTYSNVSGIVNLTPAALAQGTHTLRVAARSQYDVIQLSSLILDNGATVVSPTVSSNIIEFIGDSITEGWTDPNEAVSDYAWKTGEGLGAEHTQIAYAGICLTTPPPASNWGIPIPMSTAYLKMQPIHDFPNTPNWDFTKYTPRCVVINIGTNDNGAGVTDADFQNAYVSFLTSIRNKFPQADIFVLRTFGTVGSPEGFKAAPTQAAVNQRISAGDNKVHYVDTNGWLTVESDFTDGLHPSESGHTKAAERLKLILQPYMG